MNNYCEQGNCECKFMEDTRRYAIDVPELYKRIDTATDQYNAVVAQNKSLQGELAIYKKANKIMAEKIDEGNNGDCTYFDKDNNEVSVLEFYYKYALQELEAENE